MLYTLVAIVPLLMSAWYCYKRFSKRVHKRLQNSSQIVSQATLAARLPTPDRQDFPWPSHPIAHQSISEHALKVLHRLHSHGYDAYLVGGCIRDLYLGLRPKDFDVATNATPEQVRRLFGNARLIGRRFKLVHVGFGKQTIEVATFRASHSAETHHSNHSATGRILRDNVYGSMEDDALRRDFTVNALYYDSRNDTVISYCDAVHDIQHKQLRLIGDPECRYREDPVRMLRAVRFAAKLDFTLVASTAAPIRDLAHLLRDIPSARLFDEVLKLLQSGQGAKTFQRLGEYQLLPPLFPATHQCLMAGEDKTFAQLIQYALVNTDNRVRQERPVTPAFLYAVLLWAPMRALAQQLMNQDDQPPSLAIQQATAKTLVQQARCTAIPRRFVMAIREIWQLQLRLESRQPRAIEPLMAHPRFRAAYDFLLLRERAGESLAPISQWWTDLQAANPSDRRHRIDALRHSRGKNSNGNNRWRTKKKPRSSACR